MVSSEEVDVFRVEYLQTKKEEDSLEWVVASIYKVPYEYEPRCRRVAS